MGWTRSLFDVATSSVASPATDNVHQASPSSANAPYCKGSSTQHIEHAIPPQQDPAAPSKTCSVQRRRRDVASPELLAIARGRREILDEEDLPVYTPEEVAEKASAHWIVIDDRVYDVSTYTTIHPGGTEVFEQFAGRQCGWQFRKWHSKRHLKEWSPALLVGRVDPVPENPYPEPPRFVRTSKLK